MTESGVAAGQPPSPGALPAMDAQAQVDAIVADVQARAASMREAQASALAAGGTASSQDGTVRAVVDAMGVVTSLDLALTVFERTTPDKLARTVVATIQSAARQARAQVNSALESIREQNSGVLAAVAQETQRMGMPRVGVPEVPNTVVDPTGPQAHWPQPPAEGPAAGESADDEKPW